MNSLGFIAYLLLSFSRILIRLSKRKIWMRIFEKFYKNLQSLLFTAYVLLWSFMKCVRFSFSGFLRSCFKIFYDFFFGWSECCLRSVIYGVHFVYLLSMGQSAKNCFARFLQAAFWYIAGKSRGIDWITFWRKGILLDVCHFRGILCFMVGAFQKKENQPFNLRISWKTLDISSPTCLKTNNQLNSL